MMAIVSKIIVNDVVKVKHTVHKRATTTNTSTPQALLLCRGGFIKSIAYGTFTTFVSRLHSLNDYFPSTFPQLVRHSAICHQNNQSTGSHVER
jgi:hypothetical protein